MLERGPALPASQAAYLVETQIATTTHNSTTQEDEQLYMLRQTLVLLQGLDPSSKDCMANKD